MTHSIEEFKKQATEKTGLSDFGPDTYSAPLAAWIEDLNGPIPNDRGRKFYARLAVNDLARRLEVFDCFKRNPEIEDVVIPPIVYISGHERSGTTLLHNLLSLDNNARTLKRWELMRPTPPPETATYLTDPRIARVQAPQEKLRGTLLEHMHWVDADDPEECTWGMLNCTGLLGQSPCCVLPTWAEWLMSADMTDTFCEYRQLIKLLLWRNPVEDSGYLVLKAPQNAAHLDTLSRVFPQAHFVYTHRDPYRVATSVCALAGHTNESFLENGSQLQPGSQSLDLVLERCEKKLTSMVRLAKMLPEHISHVAYPELIANPHEVVHAIYQQAGRTAPRRLTVLIDAFLEKQRAGHRAKPPREMANFGLDHEAFLQRPRIAEYCQHFQVQAELKRATGL